MFARPELPMRIDHDPASEIASMKRITLAALTLVCAAGPIGAETVRAQPQVKPTLWMPRFGLNGSEAQQLHTAMKQRFSAAYTIVESNDKPQERVRGIYVFAYHSGDRLIVSNVMITNFGGGGGGIQYENISYGQCRPNPISDCADMFVRAIYDRTASWED